MLLVVTRCKLTRNSLSYLNVVSPVGKVRVIAFAISIDIITGMDQHIFGWSNKCKRW